jgi:uncharacterized membrane protein YhaH (DUF805 family)
MFGLLLGFEGRIGRTAFWAVQIPLLALLLVYAFYAEQLLALWLPGSIFLGYAVALLALAPLVWVECAIVIKRTHDRGKTGFWSLLLLLPVVGWAWLLIDCGLRPTRL